MAIGFADARAQMTITGTVADEAGQPVSQAQVLIATLQISTTTGDDGTYQLYVPQARMRSGMSATLTARRIGLKARMVTIVLQPNATITQNFVLEADPFLLEAVVVTGQGMRMERAKLAVTINSVSSEEIADSKEHNLVSALAGKAPNVEVTSSTGDPGGGAYIRIRGSKSIEGGTQPLVIVDGVEITNASNRIESGLWGTANANRLIDINPDDIESIEVLKGAAAAGMYGSRASNGVVLITTKSGNRNSTQVTLRTSLAFDQVNRLPKLQTRYSRGRADPNDPSVNLNPNAAQSWGPEIPPGTWAYDHAGEMFDTGLRTDNTLSLSGGSDRTTYFLSVGYLYQDGTIRGNSDYGRFTGRLKGAHDFADNLNIQANFAITTSDGDLVQQGSAVSGMLLAAFRTPPDFDNCPVEWNPCYLLPENGLHFSYLNPNPTELAESRGFDNPHWVANELLGTARVDRYIGNVQVDWDPFSWLEVRYLAGLDFANQDWIELFPKSSSDFPDGGMTRAELVNRVFDQTILTAFSGAWSPDFAASFTAGMNLNQSQFRRYQVWGINLIYGAAQLDFAVDQFPNEYEGTVRTQGYFVDVGLDLWAQLFLKGGLRYDGSNTFGSDLDSVTGKRESNWFWYPKASIAWDFSRHFPLFDFGKLRLAYGRAGVQPPLYSNIHGFDSWTYQGLEAAVPTPEQGNRRVKPEQTIEWEAGADLALLDDRLNLGLTYYHQKTEDAILGISLDPSTGFRSVMNNGASWRNWGWEATLDLAVAQSRGFTWRITAQWATNESMVDSLLGQESELLSGFFGTSSSVVQGHPFPVFFGYDFMRFGRDLTVGTVNIDSTYAGWSPGDLYVCAPPDPGCSGAGFPLGDTQRRVIGDNNPDWTGSLRTTFTLFERLRLSALVDVRHGGAIWNGTKGALFNYGTHKETEPMHGAGVDTVFQTCATCGPGAGETVTLDYDWATGLGGGFTGASVQFVEDGGYVKLRDVSLSYTWEASWLNNIGFNTLDITVSGRNLVTWTDYTGLDPESNLTGQSTGRGLEYFNHPQTRTLALTLALRR
jgi:TonB-linked SusC/RagA family outer membrane protein